MNQIPMWTRKKNSLEDVRSVLNAMGAPDRDIPAIHVAGTNGKGSVCAFLTSMLREAGYRTGTSFSGSKGALFDQWGHGGGTGL